MPIISDEKAIPAFSPFFIDARHFQDESPSFMICLPLHLSYRRLRKTACYFLKSPKGLSARMGMILVLFQITVSLGQESDLENPSPRIHFTHIDDTTDLPPTGSRRTIPELYIPDENRHEGIPHIADPPEVSPNDSASLNSSLIQEEEAIPARDPEQGEDFLSIAPPLPLTPRAASESEYDSDSLPAFAHSPAYTASLPPLIFEEGPPSRAALGLPAELPPPPPVPYDHSKPDCYSQCCVPQEVNLLFLRKTAVLLRPGEWEVDFGIEYTLLESDYTESLPGNQIAEAQARTRSLVAPLGFRFGLTHQIQAFANLPVGWMGTEVSRYGSDRFSNSGGIGDLQAGLSLLIFDGRYGYEPDIIATLGFTAPTGSESYLQSLLTPPNTQLGQGFWATSWNVTFIHPYDPVVLFYGAGGRYRLSSTLAGTEVLPGPECFYQMGLGLAVNDSITLSSTLLGSYIAEPKMNGIRKEGLIREPLRLRLAATIVGPKGCNIIEPFAEIGMTDDAASAKFGVTWTY